MGKKKPTKQSAKVKEPAPKKVKEKKESAVQIRHKIVSKKIAENGGKISKAMRETGYSPSYANNPQKLTATKSFKKLLDEYLPEDMLLKVHAEQIGSWRVNQMTFSKQVTEEQIYEFFESINRAIKKIIEIPTGILVLYYDVDNNSRNKALEMGFKLRKKLTDKVEVKDTTPYTGLTDAELAQRIKAGKNFFQKK